MATTPTPLRGGARSAPPWTTPCVDETPWTPRIETVVSPEAAPLPTFAERMPSPRLSKRGRSLVLDLERRSATGHRVNHRVVMPFRGCLLACAMFAGAGAFRVPARLLRARAVDAAGAREPPEPRAPPQPLWPEGPVAQPPWLDGVARLVWNDVEHFAETLKGAVVEIACEEQHCTVWDVAEGVGHRVVDWSEARKPLALWASARCLDALGVKDLPVAPPLAEALQPLTRQRLTRPSLRAALWGAPRRCVAALAKIVRLAVARSKSFARRNDLRERLLPGLLEDIDLALHRGAKRVGAETFATTCRRVAANTWRGDVQLYRALSDAAVAAAW